jgi:sporulation protein YlmC with PRC-barrel domain
MITRNIQQVFGADVYASEGDKIGSVLQVYLDAQSGVPEWVRGPDPARSA